MMLNRLLRFLNENNLSDGHVLLTYDTTTAQLPCKHR